jgi:hypothetical protein
LKATRRLGGIVTLSGLDAELVLQEREDRLRSGQLGVVQ